MAEIQTKTLEKLALFISELNPQKVSSAPSRFKLTTGERVEILDTLRSNFPDLLSNLGLPEEVIKDNILLNRYLSNDRYRNKFVDGVLRRLTTQQNTQLTQLTKSLEASTITEGTSGQLVGQEVQAEAVGTMQSGTEATGGQASGLPFGGLPSAPTFSSHRVPRIVYQAPPQPPKPEIAIANKSGVVVEKPEPGAKIVTANKSGFVTEPSSPSKLVTANSSGFIREPYTPPPTIHIANKSGTVIREQPLRYSSGFGSQMKTLGSRAQLLTNKAGGGIMNGLRNMAGGAARGGGDLLAKGLNSGIPGRGAISGRIGGIRSAAGSAGSSLGKAGKGRWFLLLFGFIFFGALIGGLVTSSNPTGQPVSTGPLTGAGDISGCKFTRAKNSQTIKNPQLISWIVTAANATGIPPQILASVAMHESQDFVSSASDTKYADEIKTNHYCNPGKVFCEKNGQVLHSKAEQGLDDPCSSGEIANGAKNAQAMGLMQNIDIYNLGIDLCSITENIALAAEKLKADGLTLQPTQDQVNTAIRKYYNSCDYGGYSYCNEVWTDYQNCQTSSLAFGPIPQAKMDQTVYWAKNINGALKYNTNNGTWDIMMQNISNNGYTATKEPGGPPDGNKYWCTYLVIDSYRLAGVPGLSLNQGLVSSMLSFWQNTTGYFVIPYSVSASLEQKIANLKSVRPGYAVLRTYAGNYKLDHASIVSENKVRDDGYGSIITIDANGFTSWPLVVEKGDIVQLDNHYSVNFGGISGL